VIGALARLRDGMLGRGRAAVTVPVFDGALKPNNVLDAARVVAQLEAPADIASDGSTVFVADGSRVLALDAGGALQPVLDAARTITAIACIEGGIACALDGQEIHVFGGRYDDRHIVDASGEKMTALNALVADGSRLVASDGSSSRPCDEWRHDLMEIGRSGRVFSFDLERNKSSRRSTGLGYAFGAAISAGDLLVSESWRHRIVRLPRSGPERVVLDHLPGYPSRLAPAASGGHWLTMFCARTQLVEFVLREPDYRSRMIKSIDPDLWIAPQLSSFISYHEPLQHGALKQLGRVKPWAPPRSYGLVVRLDATGQPLYSFHSRMGGPYHGIVSVAELGERLFLLSKGDRVLAVLDIPQAESELAP